MTAYKFFAKQEKQETIDRLITYLDSPYIWASLIETFNDPFEFKVAFEFPNNIEDARKRYFADNPSSSEERFQQWFTDLTPQNKWWIAQNMRESLIREYAVCCLTKSFDNHLLWSHYAKNHEGVCIEFDITDIADVAGFVCKDHVLYAKEKPPYNYIRNNTKDFLKSSCFNKSICWRYEKEFRILFDSPGKKLLPKNSIKSVYIGCRAPVDLKKFAVDNQGRNGVVFYQMCEQPLQYKLNPKLIDKNTVPMTSFF